MLAIVVSAAVSGSTIASASAATTNTNVLQDVSCVSSISCMAVGIVEVGHNLSPIKTLTERWNGKVWSVIPSPNPAHARNSQLLRVSCTSAINCFAVGSAAGARSSTSTLVERWNGKSWSIVAAPGSGLRGVSCVSMTFCISVGDAVQRWNGKSWSIVKSPADPQLASVSCVSPTSCLVVGGAHAERWNGKTWSIASSSSGVDESALESVSCTRATNCLAVGTNGGGCVDCNIRPPADRLARSA